LVSSDILVSSQAYWNQISLSALSIVGDYHQSFPLRRGMPKEELKSKLKVSARVFSGLLKKLIQESKLREDGPLIYQPGHEIKFSPQQEQSVNNLLHEFSNSPYSPPSVKDSKSAVGEDVYQAMVDLKHLVPVAPEVVFRKGDYDQMVGEVKILIQQMGTVSAAQVRDHFNTSRRYVLALLEHLDEIGVTIRQGDVRKLK
jgi:selenocysteine-specific elongation factor